MENKKNVWLEISETWEKKLKRGRIDQEYEKKTVPFLIDYSYDDLAVWYLRVNNLWFRSFVK